MYVKDGAIEKNKADKIYWNHTGDIVYIDEVADTIWYNKDNKGYYIYQIKINK